MPKTTAKKFSSLMSDRLLKQLRREADKSGHSMRFVLERAVQHYLEVVVPSSETIRPEVVAHLKASIARNDGLLRRLAKAK